MINNPRLKAIIWERIIAAATTDEECQTLEKPFCTKSAKSHIDLSPIACVFWPMRKEIYCLEGAAIKGNKILILQQLCAEVLVIPFCTSRCKWHARKCKTMIISARVGCWHQADQSPVLYLQYDCTISAEGAFDVTFRPWISIPTSCSGLYQHTWQKLYHTHRSVYWLGGGSPNAISKDQDCMWHHENLVLHIGCIWRTLIRQRTTIWIPVIKLVPQELGYM